MRLHLDRPSNFDLAGCRYKCNVVGAYRAHTMGYVMLFMFAPYYLYPSIDLICSRASITVTAIGTTGHSPLAASHRAPQIKIQYLLAYILIPRFKRGLRSARNKKGICGAKSEAAMQFCNTHTLTPAIAKTNLKLNFNLSLLQLH